MGDGVRWLAAILLVLVALAAGCWWWWPRPVAAFSIERLPGYHDPALLRRAWGLPVARRYGPAGYQFQRNPSVCGPTSIADLLRSEHRPGDPAHVMDGTGIRSWFGVLPGGLTLDQEAAALRLRTGRPVLVERGLSLARFRAALRDSNAPGRRAIVNFTRAALFGRGHGHFSPVLGYLPDRDLVFVGDVNADYRPWLAPTARLWAAANQIDPATGKPRGLLEVAAR